MRVEGSRPDSPILFVGNHLFPPRMWPVFVELNKEFNNTVYVCDGAFAPFLNMSGLQTISLDTRNKTNYLKNPLDKVNFLMTRSLGIALGGYKNSFKGEGLVVEMAKVLESGKNLVVIPASTSRTDAEWRSSIGYLLLTSDLDSLPLGFFNISKSLLETTLLTFKGNIQTLIAFNKYTTADEITQQLQKIYQQTFSGSRG